MTKRHIPKLQWKLFIPLVGMLWLIIGITIVYFVSHEKQRQKENLENRLLNVNTTVIEAYQRGVDLKKTVDFIQLFTDNTTLAPLRITVYDSSGNMIADNPEATIILYDSDGNLRPELRGLWERGDNLKVKDIKYDDDKSMICSKRSPDGKIHSFAGLPYEGEVLTFLSIDPMVWIVIIFLGLLSSALAYIGVEAVCRNVYALRDFAQGISADQVPDDIDSRHFSNDELGEVSRNLMRLYRDKIHARQEKAHHERQIAINVSHELNTPIGIIQGYLDSILDDGEMPEELKHRFLVRARENTERLAHLVGDVGKVMSLQENGIINDRSPINMREMAVQLEEDITHDPVTSQMRFVHEIPEECMVLGHESLLVNAMLNLMYNAAQHSGGTTMRLRWLREKEGLHYFEFSDNGRGVDPEHLGRLFDLFYRVDTGRSRKNGGAGLGLPLVNRTIMAMGGNITVENLASGGLKFIFSIPAAER